MTSSQVWWRHQWVDVWRHQWVDISVRTRRCASRLSLSSTQTLVGWKVRGKVNYRVTTQGRCQEVLTKTHTELTPSSWHQWVWHPALTSVRFWRCWQAVVKMLQGKVPASASHRLQGIAVTSLVQTLSRQFWITAFLLYISSGESIIHVLLLVEDTTVPSKKK